MNTNRRIRVLVVDDSMLARKLIMEGLSKYPKIEIVGYAINAMDAKRKLAQLNPDVMTCDVQMPGMSGIELLKELIPENPLPVVLVSSLNLRVFDALHAGAVDFVRKPRPTVEAPVLPAARLGGATQMIIGLGASTGGTEATLEVLKRLPEDIPGMVIVQHMPVGFTGMYAERLNRLCAMEVREAKNGDEVKRGLALLAPADYQCRIQRTPAGGYFVRVMPGDKVSGHRPSVDALFMSMAEQVRCQMVGIIMTGMGADGAEGLLEMRRKGAYTIGQDQKSSVVYGMPGVAYKIGAVCEQASCENIANVLLRYLKSKG